MSSLRYNGMPPALAARAKSNLSQADNQISSFNRTAGAVSRIPYDKTPADPAPSAFHFPGIGGPVDTNIGTPVAQSSFAQPPPIGSTTTDSSNWRFRGFGSSQLATGVQNGTPWRFDEFRGSQLAAQPTGGSMDAPHNEIVSAVKTPSNPSGIGSPVVPPNYQPKDTTKEKGLYGWGSSVASNTP